MLKLMYITNNPIIAKIAEDAGVDRIFIDMEYVGKEFRQGGIDSVKNHHVLDDVKNVKKVLKKAKLMVRVNPIHDTKKNFLSSKDEIEGVIKNGADIIMLPYFKTVEEVKKFIDYVGGRAKVILLLETPESVAVLDDILALKGIDEIHVGINDLSLGYKKRFMFEVVSDGTVENICKKIGDAGIPYGFGGIAKIGCGSIPAEHIIAEHYRIKSSMAILSRSFCNTSIVSDTKEIKDIFVGRLKEIRQFEQDCIDGKVDLSFHQNKIKEIVDTVVGK